MCVYEDTFCVRNFKGDLVGYIIWEVDGVNNGNPPNPRLFNSYDEWLKILLKFLFYP